VDIILEAMMDSDAVLIGTVIAKPRKKNY